MKLREYLEERGCQVRYLARKCKIGELTLHRLVRGGDVFLSTAKKVVSQCEGKVALEDLVPPTWQEPYGNGAKKPKRKSSKDGEKKSAK